MAAPTRPAPRPQPGWKPWASAEVVVDAMPPVATRAATATAAILVLMHMGNSIGLRRSVVARTCQLDGGMPDRVRQSRREILVIRILPAIPVAWQGRAATPSIRATARSNRIYRHRRAIRGTFARRDR